MYVNTVSIKKYSSLELYSRRFVLNYSFGIHQSYLIFIHHTLQLFSSKNLTNSSYSRNHYILLVERNKAANDYAKKLPVLNIKR